MNKNILSITSKYVLNPFEENDELIKTLITKNKKKIIKLDLGDPNVYFQTPKYIVNAYISALKNNKTTYSKPGGISELIDAVTKRYKLLYNIKLQNQDIITTSGASTALFFLNNALINKNDFAVLFNPHYPSYLFNLKMHQGKPIFGNYNEKNNWDIDIDNLQKILKIHKTNKTLKRIKYLLLTNPNNPTGTVLNKRILKQIVDISNEYDILLVSDEIYDEIIYNKASFTSIGELAKGIPHIILNGLSKNFSGTGFRIGFIIIPEQDKVSNQLKKKFRDYSLIEFSLNTPSQFAAAVALNNQKEHKKSIGTLIKKVEKRANLAFDLLNKNEFLDVVKPQGAFYIFPKFDYKKLKFKNDKEFTNLLLKEHGIQLKRGSIFGKQYHFRLVCLAPEELLQYSIDKINILLNKYKK